MLKRRSGVLAATRRLDIFSHRAVRSRPAEPAGQDRGALHSCWCTDTAARRRENMSAPFGQQVDLRESWRRQTPSSSAWNLFAKSRPDGHTLLPVTTTLATTRRSPQATLLSS